MTGGGIAAATGEAGSIAAGAALGVDGTVAGSPMAGAAAATGKGAAGTTAATGGGAAAVFRKGFPPPRHQRMPVRITEQEMNPDRSQRNGLGLGFIGQRRGGRVVLLGPDGFHAFLYVWLYAGGGCGGSAAVGAG